MSSSPVSNQNTPFWSPKDTPAENYAGERVWNRVLAFHKKRKENKSKYHLIQITIIITSAFITLISAVLGSQVWVPIVTSISGALIIILTSILQLKKYPENWILFGSTEEALRREYYFWKNNAGEYTGLDTEESRRIKLVENVEKILSSQYTEFFKMNKEKSPVPSEE
jgi:hypothetical protein